MFIKHLPMHFVHVYVYFRVVVHSLKNKNKDALFERLWCFSVSVRIDSFFFLYMKQFINTYVQKENTSKEVKNIFLFSLKLQQFY